MFIFQQKLKKVKSTVKDWTFVYGNPKAESKAIFRNLNYAVLNL